MTAPRQMAVIWTHPLEPTLMLEAAWALSGHRDSRTQQADRNICSNRMVLPAAGQVRAPGDTSGLGPPSLVRPQFPALRGVPAPDFLYFACCLASDVPGRRRWTNMTATAADKASLEAAPVACSSCRHQQESLSRGARLSGYRRRRAMSGLPVTRSWCLLPLWWLLTTCCLSPAAFMLDPGVGKGAPAQFWGAGRREGGLPQSRIGNNNAGEVRQEGLAFSDGV